MTTRSKWLIIGSAVVVLGLVLGGWAVANEVDRRFNHGPGRFLEHMDERVEALGLNETQKAEYEALKNSLRAKMAEGRTKRRELMADLKKELAKNNPDLEVMIDRIKAGMGDLNSGVGQTLDHLVGFYATLNPEQQKQIMDRFKERVEDWEKYGPRHKPWHRPGPPAQG